MSSIREDYIAGMSVEQIVAKRHYKPGMIKVIREQLREAQILRSRGARRTVTEEDGRRCTVCKEIFPCNERYFYRDKQKLEGFAYRCKRCCRAR